MKTFNERLTDIASELSTTAKALAYLATESSALLLVTPTQHGSENGHVPSTVPVASGCGHIVCSCGWRSPVLCDGETLVWKGEQSSLTELFNRHVKEATQKRKIDWSKMPVDTLISFKSDYFRYFSHVEDGVVYVFGNGRTSQTGHDETYPVKVHNEISGIEQPFFTPWFGGECPVPDGVVVEVKGQHGGAYFTARGLGAHMDWSTYSYLGDITAYRITGPAEGWEL